MSGVDDSYLSLDGMATQLGSLCLGFLPREVQIDKKVSGVAIASSVCHAAYWAPNAGTEPEYGACMLAWGSCDSQHGKGIDDMLHNFLPAVAQAAWRSCVAL
eukprot:122178-Pelagomonas_calceolata.AAC.1